MRGFLVFEVALLIMGVFIMSYTWVRQISIRTDFIPTVLNGLTSSISVIIGFTGALMTLGLSGSLFDFSTREKRKRIIPAMIALGLPLGLLWTSYSSLLDSDFNQALRVAMIGLAIALLIFIDFLGFLTLRRPAREKTADEKKVG